MSNDTAYRIRQATLSEHKRAIKKDNTNNIISLLMILTLIIGLSMIATIYYINWYILPIITK